MAKTVDFSLAVTPQYDLIDYYIGEYLYQFDQNQGEEVHFFSNLSDMTVGELKKEINLRNVAEEEYELELKNLELSDPQFSITSSYSGAKAAEYAKNYATKTNPNYKRYTLNCTNFVSQAVYAGGKTETKPSSVQNGITETTSYWYNDNYYDCTGSNSCYWRDKISTSWIRVTDFYTYWTKKGMGATTSTSKNTIIRGSTSEAVTTLNKEKSRIQSCLRGITNKNAFTTLRKFQIKSPISL